MPTASRVLNFDRRRFRSGKLEAGNNFALILDQKLERLRGVLALVILSRESQGGIRCTIPPPSTNGLPFAMSCLPRMNASTFSVD